MIGFTIIMIILIICITILIWAYMYFCSENEVKMFANPRYEERIKKLEKLTEELKKE